MFVGDEIRVDIAAAAATASLAHLIDRGTLISYSRKAWHAGAAAESSALYPAQLQPELAHVLTQGPMVRGAVTAWALRWETAATCGRLIPVLDADLTVVPESNDATLIGLEGVYGPAAGRTEGALDRAVLQRSAAAIIRSFLTHLADAVASSASARGESAAGREAIPKPS